MKTHTTYSLYREYGTLRYHVAIFREAPLPEKINVLFYNGPYELDKALRLLRTGSGRRRTTTATSKKGMMLG